MKSLGILDDEKWQIVAGCLEDMGEHAILEELQKSFESVPSQQLSYEEAKEIFGFKDRYDLFEKIEKHFGDYDSWLCRHCLASVGNDSKEMLDHLMTHTREELKKTDDGDDFEEEEEDEE